MDQRTLLDILHTAEQLKNTTRHSWTSSGRQESAAEHSWRMALMAYFLRDEFPEADLEKVMAMCILHDMGECFTGDVPTFHKTSADTRREERLLSQWIDSLPEPWGGRLREVFRELEAGETTEARLCQALDKLEVLIQHNEADLSTWIPREYTLNLHHGETQTAFSPYLTGLREAIRADTVDKLRNGIPLDD